MRRVFTFFGLIALIAATPAQADITVRYASMRPGGPTLSIAVADDGRVRAETGGDGANRALLITRDGIGYLAASDSRGPFVARQDDFFAVMGELMSGVMGGAMAEMGRAASEGMANLRFEIRAGAKERVGGREGRVYSIVQVGEEQAGPPPDMVISTDADLAPAGRELARLARAATAVVEAMMGRTPAMFDRLGELLGRGTPIRFGRILVLESVSADPIPASAFELPGPVLSRDALRTRLGGMFAPPPPPAAADDGDEGDDPADQDDPEDGPESR